VIIIVIIIVIIKRESGLSNTKTHRRITFHSILFN